MKETAKELMKITGKGQMACDINLSLAGGDIEKALIRMQRSYPGLVLNRPSKGQYNEK